MQIPPLRCGMTTLPGCIDSFIKHLCEVSKPRAAPWARMARTFSAQRAYEDFHAA